MGYTHYWYFTPSKIPAAAYREAVLDIGMMAASVWAEGVPGVMPAKAITFEGSDRRDLMINGSDPLPHLAEAQEHETFLLPRTLAQLKRHVHARRSRGYTTPGFDFCKTARKRYDIVVVAALCRLAEVPGIVVESDGGPDNWTEGARLATQLLRRPVKIPAGVMHHEAA